MMTMLRAAPVAARVALAGLAFGLIWCAETARAGSAIYAYDISGRLISVIYPDRCSSVTYDYDNANNRKKVQGESPPVAMPVTVNASVGVAKTINLTSFVSDPDNDTITVVNNLNPNRGSATVSGTVVTYTATSTGTDTFNYKINDGQICPGGTTLNSATSTITVNVS